MAGGNANGLWGSGVRSPEGVASPKSGGRESGGRESEVRRERVRREEVRRERVRSPEGESPEGVANPQHPFQKQKTPRPSPRGFFILEPNLIYTDFVNHFCLMRSEM